MQVGLALRGVDRALGVDADDLHVRRVLLEVAADAADRAAGADRDDEGVELAARLLEDLRSRRQVVRLRVRHVRVLVGLEAAGDLLGEPRRDRVVRLGRVVVDRRRRDHDLGAVAAEHRDLLLAHLVGHHEDAAVALLRRRDREPDARVARGRLDDRAAGLELPVALGRLDHREPDAVLVRAARVHVLELREQRRGNVLRDPREPHDRGVPDQVEHGWVLARHRPGSLPPPPTLPTGCRSSGYAVRLAPSERRSAVRVRLHLSPRARRRRRRCSTWWEPSCPRSWCAVRRRRARSSSRCRSSSSAK